MNLDLATHVPLATPADGPVELAPFFNPLATGSMEQIPDIAVPQFAHVGDMHVAASVWLPPSCAENRAACPAAKVVVVTDGQAANMPQTLPMLLSNSAALVMERR